MTAGYIRWTQPLVDDLRRLAHQGLAWKQIADELSVTHEQFVTNCTAQSAAGRHGISRITSTQSPDALRQRWQSLLPALKASLVAELERHRDCDVVVK